MLLVSAFDQLTVVDLQGVGFNPLLWADYFIATPASVNSDLYYDLANAPSDFWNRVASDGGDIRATAEDGTTQLPREVSGFDYANKKGSLFIGGLAGHTACYIYYGNPAATEPAANSTYGKYNVWESAAKLVAHLEDMNDSTSNQNNGSSATPPSFVAGSVLNASSYNGSTQLISWPAINNSHFTWSAWMYISSITGLTVPWGQADNSGNNEIGMLIDLSPSKRFRFTGYTTTYKWQLTRPATEGAWHFVVGTYDGANAHLYVDNQTETHTANTTDIGTGTVNKMGIYASSYKFPGKIDEARVYSRALSATEVATMYANQSSPATFWTTGGEVSNVLFYDALSCSESVSVSISTPQVNVNDTLTCSETLSVQASSPQASATDTLTCSETLSVQASSPQENLYEILTVSESVTVYITILYLSVSDSLTSSDTAASFVPILTPSVIELLTLSENVATPIIATEVSLNDALTVAEVITTPVLSTKISTYDALVATETLYFDIRCKPSVYDVLTASDVPNVVKAMCVTLSDSLTFSEAYASKTYTYGFQFLDSPFLEGGTGIKFTLSGTIN